MAMSEEAARKHSEHMKAIWAAKKAQKQNQTATAAINTKQANVAALETKVKMYESLIESYKSQINRLENVINNAALEYNARLKFMKDAVEHAYTSILFAENAAKPITRVKTEVQID